MAHPSADVSTESEEDVDTEEGVESADEEIVERFPFGPTFFVLHLTRFIREECPSSDERMPEVRIFLSDGSVLQLCHIIGVTPRWVALAVFSRETDGEMSTELVPYDLVMRVSVSAGQSRTRSIGFDVARAPKRLTGADDLSTPEGLRVALQGDGVVNV